MHEEAPQIAEHAFGYSVPNQDVFCENPEYAIMLGLRRYGWLTYDQCKIRVFSWSMENANNSTDCNARLVIDTLLELEELGLVELKLVATVIDKRKKPDQESKTFGVLEVRDANFRFTRRYESCNNKGDV